MEFVAQGLARSATLRDLESRLRGRQVIVYLTRAFLPPSTRGRTRFMGIGHGWRYLSVEVERRLSSADALAILGHELQHANEIADDGSVKDGPSLMALYRRIGLEHTDAGASVHAFDTDAAIDAGVRIYGEICDSHR